MRERSVPVGELDLTVAEAGEGGRPILLVHGFTGAKEDFTAELDRLADRGWWAVAPDLRGHGASPKPADEAAYSLERFGAEILGLAEACEWDRFVLLGHSMGGMAAQVAALTAPERLDGLILMDTTHRGVVSIDADMAALGAAIAREQGIEGVKAALDALDEPPLTNEPFLRLLEERPGYQEFVDGKFLASSPHMYAAMLHHFVTAGDRLDLLAGLDVPTLVLVGSEDTDFVAPSRAMAEAMSAAELVVIDGGGHSPQFEATEAWRTAIDGFLARL